MGKRMWHMHVNYINKVGEEGKHFETEAPIRGLQSRRVIGNNVD